MTARRELFVWYRVRRERADEAHCAVAALQRSLADRWPDLLARLLVRDEGEIATWMETYARAAAETDSPGIDREIETAIAVAAQTLVALIEGRRHSEAFEVAT